MNHNLDDQILINVEEMLITLLKKMEQVLDRLEPVSEISEESSLDDL